MMMVNLRGAVRSLLGGVALIAGPAFAQQSATDRTAPIRHTVPTGSDAALQDIVVTAQRRVERLQDVPVSAVVVGGDRIQSQALISLEQVSTTVPLAPDHAGWRGGSAVDQRRGLRRQ